MINRDDEIILRHHKLDPLPPIEHNLSPHDVLDQWRSLYGDAPDACWPIADTPSAASAS
ncbi:hypothetical protein ACIQMP_04205 [Streptomyces sp. NPDC091385]|uniref:hypothetical protein n=1 Tax=Streptomyces sp. NPDC091385 TaxID=3365997 RepID=UPI0038200B4B